MRLVGFATEKNFDILDSMNLLAHYFKLAKFALRGNRGFYEAREYLAKILIEELGEFVDLRTKEVLDIGGERGEFCKILSEKRKCQAINLEPQKLNFVHETIRGTADRLPFKNEVFDLVLLRGVLQHIPTNLKLKSLYEMRRVLKNGGIAYIMIPPWWSPLSGQNIKPFQYFGFPLAKHFSNTIMRRKIKAKNLAELGLWPMTIRSTLHYIKSADFRVLKSYDILFRMHLLTKIPVLGEVLLPSVGFILKKSE